MQHASGEEDAGSEAIEKGDRLRFLLLNEADESGLRGIRIKLDRHSSVIDAVLIDMRRILLSAQRM